MMRVLILCESAAKAGQLHADLAGVAGIECHALICRNGSSSLARFLLMQLLRLALAGPRAVWAALQLAIGRRLHVRLRPFSDEAVLRWVAGQRFDVGLHAMGIIYRRPMIDAFRLGILNAHIGILPRYRGRCVMEWSLLERRPTGVTTFFIDEGIDTGSPMVIQREVAVATPSTLASLVSPRRLVGLVAGGSSGSCSRILAHAKQQLFALDGVMFAAALERLGSPDYRPQMQTADQGRRYYAMSKLLQEVAAAALTSKP